MDALEFEQLRRAERQIDRAWYAALLSVGATVIIGLFSVRANGEVSHTDMIFLADTLVVLGLAYGVFRKSRVATGLLLIHLLMIRGRAALSLGSVIDSGVVLVFAYIYLEGLRGTLAYHRIRRGQA